MGNCNSTLAESCIGNTMYISLIRKLLINTL